MKHLKTLQTGILATALALLVLPGCKDDSTTSESSTYGADSLSSSTSGSATSSYNGSDTSNNNKNNNSESYRTQGDSTGVNTGSSVNGSSHRNAR